MERFDIAICGAGTAGLLAGYVSARLGRRTALIDCAAAPPPGDALADDAATTLRRLGLGRVVDTLDHAPCQGITCTTATGSVIQPWRGTILDRERFASDLSDAAVGAGCGIVPGRLSAVRREENAECLRLDIAGAAGVQRIEAAFAIDASGRSAAVARGLGARRSSLTNLVAAWAVLPRTCIAADAGTLAIEAADSHWWYVTVGRRIAAAAVLGRRPPRTSQAWLASARSTRLLRQVGSSTDVRPSVWPANVSMLEPTVGDGWIACGDAATTFDPLCGYGLAFAIGTGYAAARAADAFLRGDRLAPLAYADLIANRARSAWNGLDGAYEGLDTSSIASRAGSSEFGQKAGAIDRIVLEHHQRVE